MFSYVTHTRKSNTCSKFFHSNSIQFVNIIDKKKTPLKAVFSKKGGRFAACPKIHCDNIGRKRIIYSAQKIGNIDRYYYPDKRDFESDLKEFCPKLRFGYSNISSNFFCVGLANVRLKFCSQCFDVAKESEMDLYFVDLNDVSHRRATLCYGCLGNILMKLKKEIDG